MKNNIIMYVDSIFFLTCYFCKNFDFGINTRKSEMFVHQSKVLILTLIFQCFSHSKNDKLSESSSRKSE